MRQINLKLCAVAASLLAMPTVSVLLSGCAKNAATPKPAVVPHHNFGDLGMAFIPAGILQRGDHSGNGYPDERPVHLVHIDAFFLDRTEITWLHWMEVFHWALQAGYEFDGSQAIEPPSSPQHPVCNVTWYDVVKWANARSEMSGRTPVYYTDAEQHTVYRRGEIDLSHDAVDWEADGFRLPTEAEWEWAARGGLDSQHFPWPSPGSEFARWIDGSKANYWMSGDPFDTVPTCASTPTAYYRGNQEPPGMDMANGYGLYDMAGNVSEWCWDWYDDQWYEKPEAADPNSRGPNQGPGRVLRGGSWISSDKYCRTAVRYMSAAGFRCHCYGLRLLTRS